MDYYAYLESDKWKRKREQRLKIDHYTCQTCGEVSSLEVHHRYYDTLGKEDVDDDLITLCRECHEAITSVIRARRYSKKQITISDHRRITPEAREESAKDERIHYPKDSRRVAPSFAQWATGRPD